MKKFFTGLLLLILIAIGSYAVGVVITYMIANPPITLQEAIRPATFQPATTFCGVGAYLVYKLSKMGDSKDSKKKTGSKSKDGKDMDQYFDSRFLTEKELRTEKKFMFCTWETLKSSNDGMLLRSQLDGNKLLINMYLTRTVFIRVGVIGAYVDSAAKVAVISVAVIVLMSSACRLTRRAWGKGENTRQSQNQW